MNDNFENFYKDYSALKISEKSGKKIEIFKELILKGNNIANIISKNIDSGNLNKLIFDTIFLSKFISFDNIVDAGSGNGILGIPVSILNSKKKIYLVEPKDKKVRFLNNIKSELSIKNAIINQMSIKEFFHHNRIIHLSMIARGFPDNKKLLSYLKKGRISELLLITSRNKLKKMQNTMELFKQTIYNIPFRNQIKLIKLENVSRETK